MAAEIDKDKCEGCGDCVSACPTSAIEMADQKAQVKADDCADCGACVDACPKQAISMP